MRLYRSSLYGVAAIGQIPRVNLGRDRFVNHRGQDSAGPPVQWSPQAREAARRAFSTGMKLICYHYLLPDRCTDGCPCYIRSEEAAMMTQV